MFIAPTSPRSISMSYTFSKKIYIRHTKDVMSPDSFLEQFSGCYDSLPSHNSYSSLCIEFMGSALTFPNKRHTFNRYVSRLPLISGKYYEDDYYNSLERSPYPYGYEHEKCFTNLKLNTYSVGSNHIKHINDRDKYMECVIQTLSISYITKSNSFIVTSQFPKAGEKGFTSSRFVFFKQNQKLKHELDNQIKWNSHNLIPAEFSKKIREYLLENNVVLGEALLTVPENVTSYRTVLNNSFWRKTGSMYLLHSSYFSSKKTHQKRFRKNKFKDDLDSLKLPAILIAKLKRKVWSKADVSGFVKLYDKMKNLPQYYKEEDIIDQLSYILEIQKDHRLISAINSHLDVIGKFKIHFSEEEKILFLNTIFHVTTPFYNSFEDYLSKKTIEAYQNGLHAEDLSPLGTREVIKFGNKEIILHPTLEERIQAHVSCKFESLRFTNNPFYAICRTNYILNGRPADLSTFNTAFHLHEVLENSEILKAKGLPTITHKIRQSNLCQEIQLEEDFF